MSESQFQISVTFTHFPESNHSTTIMATTTKLPRLKYLKTEEVPTFDGSRLDTFVVNIESMMRQYNLPLLYGGTVRGEHEGEYEYVDASDPEGKSNYMLGKCLCAGLCSQLEKGARYWWYDYDRSGKPWPNCWRKQADNPHYVRGSVPDSVEEISLYDILRERFGANIPKSSRVVKVEPARNPCIYCQRVHDDWVPCWGFGSAWNNMSNCSDTRIQVSIVAEDTHHSEEVVSTKEDKIPEVQPVAVEIEYTELPVLSAEKTVVHPDIELEEQPVEIGRAHV